MWRPGTNMPGHIYLPILSKNGGGKYEKGDENKRKMVKEEENKSEEIRKLKGNLKSVLQS
jgi:hypothetical protein